MLTALILICSLAHSPDIRDCTRSNAVDIMVMPGASGNPATCFMHGQAYLAATDIGRNLSDTERVKVVCVRRENVAIQGTAVVERPPLRER
jgi:hypothetical protein